MATSQQSDIRQFPSPPGAWGTSAPTYGPTYPGLEYSYYSPGVNLPLPYTPQTKTASSFLSNLPLKDIKSFVDRMGGIEGMMNHLTKAQQIIKSVQQISPLIKVLFGSFLKSKSNHSESDLANSYSSRTGRTGRGQRRKRNRGASSVGTWRSARAGSSGGRKGTASRSGRSTGSGAGNGAGSGFGRSGGSRGNSGGTMSRTKR